MSASPRASTGTALTFLVDAVLPPRPATFEIDIICNLYGDPQVNPVRCKLIVSGDEDDPIYPGCNLSYMLRTGSVPGASGDGCSRASAADARPRARFPRPAQFLKLRPAFNSTRDNEAGCAVTFFSAPSLAASSGIVMPGFAPTHRVAPKDASPPFRCPAVRLDAQATPNRCDESD